MGCSDFTDIIIPNSVTSIGSFAFSGCTSLTSVTIPSSLPIIAYGLFNRCTALTSVTNLATTPQPLDDGTFPQYGTLHVLEGCKEAYQNAEVWKNFNIIDDAQEAVGICDIGSEIIAANIIFSISGKRLSAPQKGIVIINGKKVVVK